MSKFDQVYESFVISLREDEQDSLSGSKYVGSSFVDNLTLLIKTLVDNDYLKGDAESIVAHTIHQPGNVKELNLDLQDGAIPPIKIQVAGGPKKDNAASEDDDFSVTVIPVEHPENQKKFENTMLETIFSDVLNFVKTQALQGLKPEAGVETLPAEQGANAQPGDQGGASALPGVEA